MANSRGLETIDRELLSSGARAVSTWERPFHCQPAVTAAVYRPGLEGAGDRQPVKVVRLSFLVGAEFDFVRETETHERFKIGGKEHGSREIDIREIRSALSLAV